MSMGTAVPSDPVGPLQMTAPTHSAAVTTVYLVFRDVRLYILTSTSKDTVSTSCAEVPYLIISSLVRKSGHITLGLNQDPVWINLADSRTASFVRGGLRALVFHGESKHLVKITETLHLRCPLLLTAEILPPQTGGNHIDVSFSIPAEYQRDIEVHVPEITKSAKPENSFFDELGFHFSLGADAVALEVINAAVSPLIADSLEFQSVEHACMSGGVMFPVKVEWAGVSSADAMRFPHAPSTVYAFRATAWVKNASFGGISEKLRTFLEVTNWDRMKCVGNEGCLSYWMMKIHGREFWTTPAVSVEVATSKYVVTAFTMLPCAGFVKKVHKLHPGRFQEGQGHYWLPEMYNSVFMIQKSGSGISLQYIELLGWNCDPELHQMAMSDLAMQICNVLFQFASYVNICK